MAIEDAAVLASCLAQTPDDAPAALRTYEDKRQKRTARDANRRPPQRHRLSHGRRRAAHAGAHGRWADAACSGATTGFIAGSRTEPRPYMSCEATDSPWIHQVHSDGNRAVGDRRDRSRLRHDGRSAHHAAPPYPSRPSLLFLLGRLPHEIRRRSREVPLAGSPRRARPSPRARSTPARCIRRCARSAPAPARSAAWRSSREIATAETGPNPELADMTRRFWIGLAADAAGACARDGRASRSALHVLDRPDAVELAAVRARHAGRAVGRLAVLRARLAVAASRAISTCSR